MKLFTSIKTNFHFYNFRILILYFLNGNFERGGQGFLLINIFSYKE